MSEIGLNINVDSYNNEGIKTIKGNNNAEIYKLYILKNKRRLSLVGKTVKLGYVMAGTTNGDVIENLNITNAEQGEITFPITNRISKQDGVYSCQLAIYGADGFLEHTATFGLTVEDNIFTKIAGEIADSKDFTYLENILDKASKLSEKLKENTATATNANSNLESNITEANNINSKLLENTSTATSLNKNLESNIDLAKEVKETIKDLDNKNIEATEKIQTLTGLNSKAEELSNNINKGLPLNSELVKNVESAKIANNELIATNNDAKAKKTDLDNSLEEAKKYISGLDGSKNPVQMQLDIDMLKNGLKSNQSLSYEGSSITAENTLEGRSEGMRIKGKNLQNIIKMSDFSLNKIGTLENNTFKINRTSSSQVTAIALGKKFLAKLKSNTVYTVMAKISNNTLTGEFALIHQYQNTMFTKNSVMIPRGFNGIVSKKFTTIDDISLGDRIEVNFQSVTGSIDIENFLILEGDHTNTFIDNYFEGLKSFGEEEKVEDKYKISILSHGKNLININNFKIVDTTGSMDIKTINEYISIKMKKSQGWTTAGVFKLKVKPNTDYIFGRKIKVNAYGHGESTWGCGLITIKENAIQNARSLQEVGNPSREFPSGNGENIKTVKFNTGNCNYIGIFVKPTTAPVLENQLADFIISDLFLYESNNDYKYKIYKEYRKDILIKEPLHEDNYLYEDNGQVKVFKKQKQYTFTGDEDMELRFSQPTDNKLIRFGVKKDLGIKKDSLILCNRFKNIKYFVEEPNIFCHPNDLCVDLTMLKSDLTTPDIEGFKAWLKANPTTIIYQLATPVVEIVENCVDIDLDTFEEKTYFNILNSLPGSLDFKVPSNLGSSLQNLAKEVNNIWDVINNLLVPSIVKANGNLAMIKLNNNLK